MIFRVHTKTEGKFTCDPFHFQNLQVRAILTYNLVYFACNRKKKTEIGHVPVSRISKNKVLGIECYTELDNNKLKGYAVIQINFENSFETSKSSKYLTQAGKMDGSQGRSACCVNMLTRVQFTWLPQKGQHSSRDLQPCIWETEIGRSPGLAGQPVYSKGHLQVQRPCLND